VIDFDRLLNVPATAVFGRPVLYWKMNRPARTIRGIFDHRHVEIAFGDDGAPVSARRTTLHVRAADLTPDMQPAQGDVVTIDTTSWIVTDVQPDATGAYLVILGARALTDHASGEGVAGPEAAATGLPMTPGATGV
jgi:hypothetical protein